MPDFLSFLLIIALLIWVGLPLNILVHELGHAIPALIFTRDPVGISLLTYGQSHKIVQVILGRLHIVFPKSLKPWFGGYIMPFGYNYPRMVEALILLGGPFASLFLGLSALFTIHLWGPQHSLISVFGFLTGLLGIIFFVLSIFPNASPSQPLKEGKMYNDGYLLADLYSRQPAQFYYNKAYFAVYSEKWEKVHHSLDKIGDRIQEFPDAHTLRFYALVETLRLDEAEALMENKIRPQLTGIPLTFLEVILYAARERYSDAEELLKTETAEPTERELLQQAQMYMLLKQEKFELVIQLSDSFSNDKKAPVQNDYYYTGIALQKLKRHEEALQMLRRAEKNAPFQLSVHVHLANVNLSLGRLDEAKKALKRAAQINAENPYYLCVRSRWLRMTSRHQEALESVKLAHSLRPDMKEIQEELRLAEEANYHFSES